MKTRLTQVKTTAVHNAYNVMDKRNTLGVRRELRLRSCTVTLEIQAPRTERYAPIFHAIYDYEF